MRSTAVHSCTRRLTLSFRRATEERLSRRAEISNYPCPIVSFRCFVTASIIMSSTRLLVLTFVKQEAKS